MIQIFCDGACVPNPGVGAWALTCTFPNKPKAFYLVGVENHTTNNRAELWGFAASLVIADLFPEEPVEIFCDSQYAMAGIAGSQKKTKKNQDLLERMQGIWPPNARAFWVRGHYNCAGNNRADKLAVAAIKRRQQKKIVSPIFGGWDKYKYNYTSQAIYEFKNATEFSSQKNFQLSPKINLILREMLI